MSITIEHRQRWLNALWEVFKMDMEDKRFPELKPILDGYVYQLYHTPLDGDPPIPPPPSDDPLARIKAAPSQWAKWIDQSSAESEALIAGGYLTREDKNRLNNWWQLNGVKGRREGNRYIYFTYPGGQETTNVDTGGADAATEQACGLPIPGPALP